MTSSIDLIHCTPSELTDYLLQHRFPNDGAALTTFLLESISSLPDAQAISDHLCKETSTSSNSSKEEALVSLHK